MPNAYDLGLHHSVDETREEFGLVRAEHMMAAGKAFKTNGELDIARSHNVLDLEIRELGVEAEFLDDASILARGQFGIVLGLCTSDDHLARGEDQSSRLGFADTHDDSGETLKRGKKEFSQASNKASQDLGCLYLWVVLCVTSVQCNRLQVKSAVKVHRGDDVS